jgi:hypothetical protein
VTYVHRAGRTARYNTAGESLLVLLPQEEAGMLKQLHAHKVPITKIEVSTSHESFIIFRFVDLGLNQKVMNPEKIRRTLLESVSYAMGPCALLMLRIRNYFFGIRILVSVMLNYGSGSMMPVNYLRIRFLPGRFGGHGLMDIIKLSNW